MASIKHIEILLYDPDLLFDRLRANAGINQLEGVGVSEAPRGTLFHHYQVDENGLIQQVNESHGSSNCPSFYSQFGNS